MTLQIIGLTLVHSVWEGGAIASVLALVFALMRHSRASIRYVVGMAGLILMVALPIATAIKGSSTSHTAQPARETITAPVNQVSPIAEPRATAGEATSPTPEAMSIRDSAAPSIATSLLSKLEPSLPVLVIAWLLGLVLLSGRMIYGVVQTRRIIQLATQPSPELSALIASIAKRLHIRRALRAFESAHINVPMVIGFIRPAIVVPASFFTALAPWQLEMLVAHELAHIRRYDFLANMLQTVIETLLFFHPAAWWLSERIREERENCCDDIAVRICGGDNHGYTATLLALEETRHPELIFAAAADGNSDRGALLRRAMRLMTGAPAHLDLGGRWIAGVITILAALFTTGPAVGRAAAIPLASKLDVVGMLTTESEPKTIEPVRAKADTVLRYSGAGSFADRWQWAEQRGRQLSSRRYWVGYLVAGDANDASLVYMDRETPVRSGTSTFMGRMRIGDTGNLIFTGSPLAPLLGNHAARSTAIFLEFDRSAGADQVARVHVGSYNLPVYFAGTPVIWIDSAGDNESISKLRALYGRQPSQQIRKDLIAAIGMHHDANAMLPVLTEIISSNDEPESIRREAIDAIADIRDPRAIGLLARVARTDRSTGVSQEAIEALENVRSSAATDTLIAFATSMTELRLRRTAIETLGNRDEPRVVAFMKKLANDGSDDRSQRDAIEALANMHEEGFTALSELALNARDARIRGIAVEQLPDADKSAAALGLLVRIAQNDPDESVQRKAIEALGETRDKEGLAALRSIALGKQTDRLRREAMEAYVDNADSRSVISFLESIIANDPSMSLRFAALESLAELDDGAGKAAVRALARTSPDPSVRRRAASILDER
ncbi:MAG TPA: HEAT repeat domain-containing protein [Gemmatimonadaceae bacterium]|nr:HEAT repeat domain-containing protein [Gemmatimonadaceae bacterium]